jgi:hypothetical protein
MCRADLPVPVHAVQPQHIIVPVPVIYNDRRVKVVRVVIGVLGLIGGITLLMYPYYP